MPCEFDWRWTQQHSTGFAAGVTGHFYFVSGVAAAVGNARKGRGEHHKCDENANNQGKRKGNVKWPFKYEPPEPRAQLAFPQVFK